MAVSSEVLLADIEARPNVTGTLLIDATDAKILSVYFFVFIFVFIYSTKGHKRLS